MTQSRAEPQDAVITKTGAPWRSGLGKRNADQRGCTFGDFSGKKDIRAAGAEVVEPRVNDARDGVFHDGDADTNVGAMTRLLSAGLT